MIFFVFLKVREKDFKTHPRTAKSVHGARSNDSFKLVANRENPGFPRIFYADLSWNTDILVHVKVSSNEIWKSVNHRFSTFFLPVDLVQNPYNCVWVCIMNFCILKKDIFLRFRFFLLEFSHFWYMVERKTWYFE